MRKIVLPIRFSSLCLLLISQICISTTSVNALTAPSPSPTPSTSCIAPNGYTPIITSQQLSNIRTAQNSKYFLCNDIVLQGAFEPIPNFSGELEGNNKRILNLSINKQFQLNPETSLAVGLFNTISAAKIRNLIIEQAKITTLNATSVGTLTGLAYQSRIENITIRNSKIVATLSGPSAFVYFHGGVTGATIETDIIGAYINYDVSIDAPHRAGGVVGVNMGSIQYAQSRATIRVLSTLAGGIASDNLGEIKQSHAAGVVSGVGLVGGVVAYNRGSLIDRTSSHGIVSGEFDIGGFAGVNFSIDKPILISNCYSSTTVKYSGEGVNIGGFVGSTGGVLPSRIENSYTYSILSGTPNEFSTIGSFAAQRVEFEDLPLTESVSNYYDSERNIGVGSALAEPRRTIELKTFPPLPNTFVGWDLSTIWSVRNGSYPRLRY
jgi:hypothetical protein